MKKKLLATILSSALVVSMLAGCGSTAEAPAADDAATEEATTDDAADDAAAWRKSGTCAEA